MNKRKEGLDLLRLICAFWVICAHKRFPGDVGVALAVFARLIVPIFLMITGFFPCPRFPMAMTAALYLR